jgi:hypothetical protein
VNIISNSHEHSLVVGNLTICVMRAQGKEEAELIVSFAEDREVILTAEQARELRSFLLSKEVTEIL